MSLLDYITETLPPTPYVPAQVGPGRMTHLETARMRAAAVRACQLYPGPVGDTLAREILSWHQFGWRFGGDSRTAALVEHLLGAPLPAGEGI